MDRQRGLALIEAVVATGVVAFGVAAILFALATFAPFGAHGVGPNRVAATAFAEQILRTAEDAWKYGPIGNAPAGQWSTTVPVVLPSATPTSIPVSVTATLLNPGPAGATLSISVSYPPDAGRDDSGNVALTGTLTVKAPLPGSQIVGAGRVPMPAGAP